MSRYFHHLTLVQKFSLIKYNKYNSTSLKGISISDAFCSFFFFSVSQIDPLAIGKRALGQKTMFKVVIKGKQYMTRLKQMNNQDAVI